MRIPVVLLSWSLAALLGAQNTLGPGEGAAWIAGDGTVRLQGSASSEGPMGDLSVVPWLRLEGAEWGSRGVRFKCGTDPSGCGGAKGHGGVDLRKAVQQNCRRAILAWIQHGMGLRARVEGEAPARIRLVETFVPFLGSRLPPAEGLPTFGPEWCGEGQLLRASPERVAKWLADPAQEGFSGLLGRLGSGYAEGIFGVAGGWAFVGQAGSGKDLQTWVLAGSASTMAVFRFSGPLSREAALRRAGAMQVPLR
ncbi:MAG: hypothetical protein HY823_02240 [Acidobacteria bacterium]|nr:hypothetical protein [Acidobacteriota bacterium]